MDALCITLRILCDETRATGRRIDGLLPLDACERKMGNETRANLDELAEADLNPTKQWSGFRAAYTQLEFREPQVQAAWGPVGPRSGCSAGEVDVEQYAL